MKCEFYTKFGSVIHSWPNVSLRRSISRTQRLTNFTPLPTGFGVDGFSIRVKKDGRVDARTKMTEVDMKQCLRSYLSLVVY